ncbi:ISNCY family transposase [Microbulbifer sp.]|uniref:ISNCY family transposase n=1 Tax=Microbulbifer sp. TaxID=1908541 RepID=UPI003F371D5A
MRETRTVQQSIFDFYAKHEFGDFLAQLSNVLDDRPELIALLEGDLIPGDALPTGRKGLSVESVLRCLLLKQITGVSYDKLAFHLADSQSYRAFARLERDCYPSKSALCTNIRRIQPETLQKVFEQLAVNTFSDGVIDNESMRLDSTVVKSNIVSPSDSGLLDDGIRVLSRLFEKAKDRTGVKLRLTDYRKPSRQLAAAIFYGKKAEKDKLYEELLPLAKRVIKQSHKAIDQVELKSTDPLSQFWIEEVRHYRGLLEQVIDQTERRVIYGEKVPASEKIVSLFEPHTDIIVKAKRGIDYGHKVNLSTDKNGFITTLLIENGNPSDSDRFIPILEEYQRLYGSIPTTTVADGCYASHKNVDTAKELGVKRVAFHRKNGITLGAMGIKEKTLRKLRNFRAGIEANISELKRVFGAGKAMWKGENGFMAFVWSSVISYNLTHLVRMDSG